MNGTNDTGDKTEFAGCGDCPKRETCTELCPPMRRALPRMDRGARIGKRRTICLGSDWDDSGRGTRTDAIANDDAARRSERIGRMRHLLDRSAQFFTKRQAEIAEMYYWQGLSSAEIGAELGILETTVGSHRRYILRVFRWIAGVSPPDWPVTTRLFAWKCTEMRGNTK